MWWSNYQSCYRLGRWIAANCWQRCQSWYIVISLVYHVDWLQQQVVDCLDEFLSLFCRWRCLIGRPPREPVKIRIRSSTAEKQTWIWRTWAQNHEYSLAARYKVTMYTLVQTFWSCSELSTAGDNEICCVYLVRLLYEYIETVNSYRNQVKWRFYEFQVAGKHHLCMEAACMQVTK